MKEHGLSERIGFIRALLAVAKVEPLPNYNELLEIFGTHKSDLTLFRNNVTKIISIKIPSRNAYDALLESEALLKSKNYSKINLSLNDLYNPWKTNGTSIDEFWAFLNHTQEEMKKFYETLCDNYKIPKLNRCGNDRIEDAGYLLLAILNEIKNTKFILNTPREVASLEKIILDGLAVASKDISIDYTKILQNIRIIINPNIGNSIFKSTSRALFLKINTAVDEYESQHSNSNSPG